MQDRLRIGIIGCGRIAVRHVEACLGARGVELTALVDPVEAHARGLAERFHIRPFVTPNLEQALGHIDGAIVATPNHLHEPVAVACLDAGVSTLIEKPLATSAREGEAICRAAEKSGAVAAVAYVTRFRKSVQLMGRLLTDKYFGSVGRFAYQSGTNGGWSPLSGYNLDRGATGGGVLVVTGTHFLDRMLYWFGYPDRVELQHDGLGGPEANAAAMFEFDRPDRSIRGTARFSKTIKLPSGFVMETEAGIVLLGDNEGDGIRLRPFDRPDLESRIDEREEAREDAATDTVAFFRRQIEDFVAACWEKRAPMVAAREGLQSLRLLDELYAKASPLSGGRQASSLREVAVA